MTVERRQRFVLFQTGLMLASVVALAALDLLDLELFFVVSLLGLLVLSELSAPVTVEPAWRRRLKLLVTLGLLAFGLVVLRRALAVLSIEVGL